MNQADLQFLQSEQKYPSISIFISCHKAMPEKAGNQIALKNSIKEAKDRLLKEFSKADLKQVFDNLDALISMIDLSGVYSGLAIFVNAHIKKVYELPFAVKNRVVIDSTFITRDIIKTLHKIQKYWVLCLGKKSIRFYHGIGRIITEIIEPVVDANGNDKDGFPFDYLPPNVDSEHALMGDHLHRDAQHLDNFRDQFFRKVDGLLSRFLTGEPLPLIILGDERNCVAFKNITKANNIIGFLHGDYCETPKINIEKAIAPILEKYNTDLTAKKIEEFVEAIGKMHHAFGMESVWRMGSEGRIKDLLIEEGFSVPGIVNPKNDTNIIIYDKADSKSISDDLVNLLAEIVIEKGGNVLFCKPGSLEEYNHIAAILRY